MTSQRSGIERKLECFIVDELLDEPCGGRDPLVAEAVDSLDLEQLVLYIETQFGVSVGDEEMVRENFASLPVLAAFIESKQGVATK